MANTKDKTFHALWNEAYIAYLKQRKEYGIPLTNEQKERLSGQSQPPGKV